MKCVISKQLTDEQRQLVLDNQKLVFKEYNKLGQTRLVQSWKEDLIQEGFWGACCAAITFDNTRGVPFSSYAVPCIRNEMLKMLRWLKNERVEDEDIKSLEQIIEDDTGNSGFSFLKVIKDESFDYSSNIDRYIDLHSFLLLIPKVLTDKQYEALKQVWKGKTYQQIADERGVRKQAIGRLVVCAQEKLKKIYNEISGEKENETK